MFILLIGDPQEEKDIHFLPIVIRNCLSILLPAISNVQATMSGQPMISDAKRIFSCSVLQADCHDYMTGR